MRRTLLLLPALLAASGLLPGTAAAAKSPKKRAPAAVAANAAPGTGSVTGTVTIRGRIKKVKKTFNPYADIYGGGGGAKPAKTDEPGHLCVYLEGEAGPSPVPAGHAVLDQQDRAFSVDLLPVLAGTTVDFTNHDRIYHNVFSYSEPDKFDLGRRGQGEMRSVTFDKLPPRGIGVIKINCEIHANMRATVLVMRNPWWAVVPEAGGAFELKDVAPGTYTLTGWHGSLAPVPVTVKVVAGAAAHADLVMQGDQ